MNYQNQIQDLLRRAERLEASAGKDAPFAKQLRQQASALERRAEQESSGQYPENPVDTYVAGMSAPRA